MQQLGFGKTLAGRGGPIRTVTHLNDDASRGSLRRELEGDEPKTVIFDVALKGILSLRDELPVPANTSLLGGRKVVLTGGRVVAVGSDVHIKDITNVPLAGPGQELQYRDAFAASNPQDERIERVCFQNCTGMHAGDEGGSGWNGADNLTFMDCFFIQALEHPNGSEINSYGMLIGDGADRVTILRTLFAGNRFRSPSGQPPSRTIELLNSAIIGAGNQGVQNHGVSDFSIVGNYFGPMHHEDQSRQIMLYGGSTYIAENSSNLYTRRGGSVNTAPPAPENRSDAWDHLMPAHEVFDYVLRFGGATPRIASVIEAIGKIRRTGTLPIVSEGRIAIEPATHIPKPEDDEEPPSTPDPDPLGIEELKADVSRLKEETATLIQRQAAAAEDQAEMREWRRGVAIAAGKEHNTD